MDDSKISKATYGFIKTFEQIDAVICVSQRILVASGSNLKEAWNVWNCFEFFEEKEHST